jgi:hypothetical protein
MEILESVKTFIEYDDIEIDSIFKKYTGEMPVYDKETILYQPSTYGFIDMKSDKDYWSNVLKWNYVKKRPKLSKYINYQLNKNNSNDTIFLEKELFEDGGIFSNPTNFRKLMNNLLTK